MRADGNPTPMKERWAVLPRAPWSPRQGGARLDRLLKTSRGAALCQGTTLSRAAKLLGVLPGRDFSPASRLVRVFEQRLGVHSCTLASRKEPASADDTSAAETGMSRLFYRNQKAGPRASLWSCFDLPVYQIFTRWSGAKYSVSPGFTSNEPYHASMFRTVSARYSAGECESVATCARNAASRDFPA